MAEETTAAIPAIVELHEEATMGLPAEPSVEAAPAIAGPAPDQGGNISPAHNSPLAPPPGHHHSHAPTPVEVLSTVPSETLSAGVWSEPNSPALMPLPSLAAGTTRSRLPMLKEELTPSMKLHLHPKADLPMMLAHESAARLSQIESNKASTSPHRSAPGSPERVHTVSSPGNAPLPGDRAVVIGHHTEYRPESAPKVLGTGLMQNNHPPPAPSAQPQYTETPRVLHTRTSHSSWHDPVDAMLGRYQVHKVIMSSLGRKAVDHTQRLAALEVKLDEVLSPQGSPPRAPPNFDTVRSVSGGPYSRPSTAGRSAASEPSSPVPRFTLAETDAEHKLGAYLHYADASFAGSRPFKAATAAKQEGLLYERYTSREAQQQQDKDSGSAALTSLQTRYLRPVKGTQPPIKTTRMLTLPKVPQPPMRALPNGVPVSRIEHHSARRGARSPPRYGSPQPTQQQQQQDSSPRYGSPSQNIVQSQGTELEAFLAELGSIEALAPQPSQSRLAKPGPSQGGSPGVSGGGASSAAAPGMPLQRMTSTVLKPKSMMPGEGLGGSSAPPAALSAQSVSAAAAALRQKSIAGRAGASRLELLASQPGQTSGKTGEPLLDDAFYSALQDHFRSATHEQTNQLRGRLNASLPTLLQALNLNPAAVAVTSSATTFK